MGFATACLSQTAAQKQEVILEKLTVLNIMVSPFWKFEEAKMMLQQSDFFFFFKNKKLQNCFKKAEKKLMIKKRAQADSYTIKP